MTIDHPVFTECIDSPRIPNSCQIPLCAGCCGPIHDQYILKVAPNLEWHAGCLKCTDCGQVLDETCTCFVKDGKTYCKKDYTKYFGAKCSKCKNGFSKNDFVMRAKDRIFHIDCFRCVTCHRQLIPGDEFALHGNDLFCKADHDVISSSDIITGNTDPHCIPSFSSSAVVPSLGVTSNHINGMRGPRPAGTHRSNGSSISGQKRKDSKPTRVRTVLNEKQLHTLRTCYAANCRPDALMKEQLTEMTGLSARVIRVWFQNKRCKDKKRSLAMKQMQEQAKQQSNGETTGPGSNSQGINAVPMIASEPVTNNSPHPKPVEVQNYHQPAWKALSELALQREIEQPAFQNLMSNFSDQGQGSISDSSDICSIPSVSSAGLDIGSSSTPISVVPPEINSASACT